MICSMPAIIEEAPNFATLAENSSSNKIRIELENEDIIIEQTNLNKNLDPYIIEEQFKMIEARRVQTIFFSGFMVGSICTIIIAVIVYYLIGGI